MLGTSYLNNVRVNGILPAGGVDPLYLLGCLNGPVADFVFRRIGKPKSGGYFEANKQFIAPIPIPTAQAEERAVIAGGARALQTLWTERRNLIAAAAERLSTLARVRHDETWLWPDLPRRADEEAHAPRGLRNAGERHDWADQRVAEAVARRMEGLQAVLDSAEALEPSFRDGELSLFADGAPVIRHVYLDEGPGKLAEAYWRWLLLTSPRRDAETLARDLRRPPSGFETPAAVQFIAKVGELADGLESIRLAERDMNERLYQLYGLTPAERLLVENDRKARAGPSNQG